MSKILPLEEENLDSWNIFINEKIPYLKDKISRKNLISGIDAPEVYFRGERNDKGTLLSTLNRRSPEFSIKEYHNILQKLFNDLKSEEFGELFREDTLETFSELSEHIFEDNWLMGFPRIITKLMVFLRHHSFVSPFLDWTTDPKIASFFAFNNADEGQDFVSIFCLKELNQRMGEEGDPYILTIRPKDCNFIERHKAQKGLYTASIIFKKEELFFGGYNEYFSNKIAEEDGATFIKYNIPVREKRKVLSLLNNEGINAFTLFKSGDGLCNFLERKYFDKLI